MKKYFDYISLIIISLVLSLLIFLAFLAERNRQPYFYININCYGKEQIIEPYVDENSKEYFFFIPSYFSNVDTIIYLNKQYSLTQDGKAIDYTKISNILINKKYELLKNNIECGKVYFISGSEIPTVYISTSSGNTELFLEEDKHNNETGSITVIDSNGNVDYSDFLISISGRGNDTWQSYKKGWSLKLNSETNLLGMKKSANWVLLGNFRDYTDGLRNYAAYSMADSIGLKYTSKLKFVDLYIDRKYEGLYMLAERIEQSDKYMDIGNLNELNNLANRSLLDVNRLEHEEINEDNDNLPEKSWSKILSPSNISGGYILERNYGEKLEDKNYIFFTDGGEGFVVRYPEVVSKDEIDYIADVFQHVENALFSYDYIDKNSGKELEELIDLDSFVKKYLIDEVTKNEGAGSTSCYYYKKQGDSLLYAGPVWDYDKAFGTFGQWKDPNGLTYSSFYSLSPTFWYKELYNYEKANRLIKEYYINFCRPYMTTLNGVLIDEWSKQIEKSYYMNWMRYRNELLTYENFDNRNEEYFEDISNPANDMKKWIAQRIEYLDSEWIENK